MAKAGDFFVAELKDAHVAWGEHRHTSTRDIQHGEAYIQIPASDAYRLSIKSFKGAGNVDAIGENLFYCTSSDGFLNGIIRAQGEQSDNRYAKQFSMDKDLKELGRWFTYIGAKPGDIIKVTWESANKIIIEKL